MKIINLLSFFLIFNSLHLFSQDYADKIDAVLDNDSAIKRGKIKTNNQKYSLYYFDKFEQDSDVKKLQEKGFHGGGPSWLAMIYAAFNIYEENIIDNLNYDIEVTGISFTSNNQQDIEMIAKVIGLIKSDEAVMNSLIDQAKKLNIMK